MNPAIAASRVNHLLNQENPIFIMMVGVPGCGKSTFIRSLGQNIMIASTDDMIEEKALQAGKTYSQIFDKINHKHLKLDMIRDIKKAIVDRHHVALDRTNMSRKTRSEFIDLFPDNYTKVCLNFSIDDKVLRERLKARAEATGKVIPEFVLFNMFKSYNPPIKDEGFDIIIEVDTSH